MPYEKNNGEEVRSGGRKSVTKKGSTPTKGTGTRPSGTAKSGTGSTQRTGTASKSAGSPNRSGSSAKNTTTGAKKTTAASKPKTTQNTTAQSKAKTPQKTNTSSKPKTTSSSYSQSKQTPTSQNKPRSTSNTQNMRGNTARNDYKLFEESSKEAERRNQQRSKAAEAKKTTSQSARRSSGNHKKGKSHSRSKLVTVLTYVMMIVAFGALMVTLSLTVFFKIDDIKVEVKGTEYYSEDSIIEISGIEMGENIFSIPKDEVEKNIEKQLPYIEDCKVKRSFPTGIRIIVTGAQPEGVVTLQTGVRIVLSSEGKSLELLPPADDFVMSGSDVPQDISESDISATDIKQHDSSYIDETQLPEIVGLTVTGGMEEGEYIEVSDETALATMRAITTLLRENNLPPTKIDLSAGDLYSYYDGRIRIKLGSGADLEMKIKIASDIILNKLSEYDSGRVDVSSSGKGYFTPEYMLD